uniref:SH3 and PX domain-containing protein 2A-like n=1 Tax=Ciona intestinalis TaxID=7719 RepID=UPI000180C9E0|nr:SH3 and PX domain-containing protein 2A-like [Ciona intestinalis]|eukprot:XP_002125414.1 SH3 and PX domain-containing protein 2A-like [Ciona intestinalis]
MSQIPKRLITAVNVNRAEKRRVPSKHYVYVIEVSWDDGSDTVIFRRYSKFFDLQISLLETFPKEGGMKDPSTRIIPFLPGKILFRRSNIRDVAMKRVLSIGEYCKDLIKLPSYIVQHSLILDFFETKPEDLKPPESESTSRASKRNSLDISQPILPESYVVVQDYIKTQPKELNARVGEVVEVMDKHENGWWFVSTEDGEQGWVPGVYLGKPDGKSENLVIKQDQLGQGELYLTTTQYNGEDSEVSFNTGVLVEVLQKNLEGWWFVSYNGKQGWAPASYLTKPPESVTAISLSKKLSSPVKNDSSIPSSHSCTSLSSQSSSNAGDTSSPSHKRLSGVGIKRPSLKPQVPPPPPPQHSDDVQYIAMHSFDGKIPHGVAFNIDDPVTVLSKSPGWWYVEVNGNEGWAPETYISKTTKPKPTPARPQPPSFPKKTELQRASHTKVTRSSSLRQDKPAVMDRVEHTYSNDTNFRNFKPKPTLPKKPLKPAVNNQKPTFNAGNGQTPLPNAVNGQKPLLNTVIGQKPMLNTGNNPKPLLNVVNGQKPMLSTVNSQKPLLRRVSSDAVTPPKPPVPSSKLKPVTKSNDSSPRRFVSKVPVAKQTKQETNQVDFRSVLKPAKQRGVHTNGKIVNKTNDNDRTFQAGKVKNLVNARNNINNNNNKSNVRDSNLNCALNENFSTSFRSSPDGEMDNTKVVGEGYFAIENVGLTLLVAVCDFEAVGSGELGFTEGSTAELLEESAGDWWYVKIDDKSGWVPSGYFKPVLESDGLQ